MHEFFLNRVTAIWFLLVVATVLSYAMGHGVISDDVRQMGIAILIVSMIKVRFVILDFMEVRHAPRLLRVIAEAWVILLCALLLILYLAVPL